jgi:anaerobic selenocysteine-containing dehydrogenase
MNWDRRAFVKFVVGAVAGLHASPLVPKLMDDVAIWTQNWSWVPVPEKGELAFANTYNPATGTACRARLVQARVSGKRVIRVEGNPEHPICQGGVVPADVSMVQASYYNGMRVTSPVMRVSKSGVRRPVSWDEALKALGQILGDLARAGKAHALAVVADDPYAIHGEMLMRLLAAYGSPNLVFLPSARDTLAVAGQIMFGQSEIGFDLFNSQYTLSFGTPLLEGFGAPVATRKAFAAWRSDPKKRGVLVQVEPRASVTASQADLWLACAPGSEAAVALGICSVLIQAGAVSQAAASAEGFDQFKALVLEKFSPAQVAYYTGVSRKKLVEVAKGFAQAERAVAVCGPGNAGEPGRVADFMAVLALNVLKGNLGRPGGVLVRRPLPLKPLGGEVAMPSAPRLDGGDKRPLGVGSLQTLAENALAGKPYPLQALIVVNCNPAYSGPQAEVMKELCQKVPLLVSISPWMDETASMADIVLPAATFLEGWGDGANPYGSPWATYGIHRPLATINPQAASLGDCVLALAKAIGGPVAEALPFESVAEALAARTADMGDFEELAQRGWWVQEKPGYGDFPLQTPSGRVVLVSGQAAAMWEPPAALKTLSRERPLLMAAVPSLRTGTGRQPLSPYMLKILDDTVLAHRDQLVVEMNPVTAEQLELKEGDLVQITSRAGQITARLHLFAGAAPGMVFVPVGLGHSAFGMYLKDKGANYYQAVEVEADPVSGLPQWGLTAVSVAKAGEVSHV